METKGRTHPYTYRGPGRLSGLYALGRDGRLCPVYARERTSSGYAAWKAGHDEHEAAKAVTCTACGTKVELGTCCPKCDVYFGDACPTCGQYGYHARTCATMDDDAPYL